MFYVTIMLKAKLNPFYTLCYFNADDACIPGSLKVFYSLFDDQSDHNTYLLQRLYFCT